MLMPLKMVVRHCLQTVKNKFNPAPPPAEYEVGYSFTNDPKQSYPTNPIKAIQQQKHIFFDLRHGLGPFEIRDIVKTPNGPRVLVYSAQLDQEFKMPEKWFDYLFEPITLPDLE